MIVNRHNKVALNQAKIFFADLKRRGNDAIGKTWEEVRKEIFSAEEIAESDIRTTKIVSALSKIHARKKQILKAIKFEEYDLENWRSR